MEQMFRAIGAVLKAYPHVKALYPIHLNPEIRSLAEHILGGLENIHIIEPLDVVDFHNIMAPVSYTHLDVYKRQARQRLLGLREGRS